MEVSYRKVSESICHGLEINHKRSLCCLKKHLNIQFTICFSLRRYVTYIYSIQFLSDAYFKYIRTRYSPTHHVFHKYTAIMLSAGYQLYILLKLTCKVNRTHLLKMKQPQVESERGTTPADLEVCQHTHSTWPLA